MTVTNQLQCVCGVSYWPNQAWQHRGCVSNTPVTNAAVTNSVSNVAVTNQPVANSLDGVRVTNWRKANPERYREYMREYMKRRRERARVA